MPSLYPQRGFLREQKSSTPSKILEKTGCSAADFSSSVAETVCRMKVTVMLHIHYSSSDDHPVKCNLRWKCLEVFLLKAPTKALNKLSNLPVMSIHTYICTYVHTCRTASRGGGGFLFLHRLERVQVTFLKKPI